MPRVALPDRHHADVAHVPAHPHHVLDAGPRQVGDPAPTGAHLQAAAPGARPHGRVAVDDGVVPVVDRLDPDHRLGLAGADGPARVVARPFAEGTLVAGFHVRRRHLSLHRHLRVRRDRQARHRARYDLHRPLPQPSRQVQLTPAPGNPVVGGDEDERVAAEGGHHRAAPALLPVALADLPPVLARAHPQAQEIAAVDLHAVGPRVHETALRVAVDDAVAGADVSAAVHGVVARRREAEQVHVLPGHDVPHHRPVGHLHRRDRLHVPHLLRRQLAELRPGFVNRQPQRQRRPLVRGGEQPHHPEARRIALDVVEQQHGRVRDQLPGHLPQRADLLVPVRLVDLAPVIDLLARLHEFLQAVESFPVIGMLCIRIALDLRYVVVGSHFSTCDRRAPRFALRARMMRMNSPLSRRSRQTTRVRSEKLTQPPLIGEREVM